MDFFCWTSAIVVVLFGDRYFLGGVEYFPTSLLPAFDSSSICLLDCLFESLFVFWFALFGMFVCYDWFAGFACLMLKTVVCLASLVDCVIF